MIRDPERRKFLVGLLGIPAAYMMLDADEKPLLRPTRVILNNDHMAFYEGQLEANWKVFHLGGTSHAAPYISRWMHEVSDFARQTCGTPWQRRALTVLCMSYQLKGDILGDKRRYRWADAAYTQALSLAGELKDPELQAAALVRQAVILIGQKRQQEAQEAIKLLQSALDLIKDRGFVTLRGNALQVLADAYARMQRPRECWSTIDLAESVLQQKTQVRERSQRVFNEASLTAHKGLKALLLHDYERALTLLDKGMASYNPALAPRRARFLVKKAEAYYGQCQSRGKREIEACTTTAEEAWDLAQSVGAGRVMAEVGKLYADLMQSRWKNEGCVRRLGGVIASRR